ncbi:hypothetical protein ACA910_019531 [Epithemia clementina (nom. ined.)]
MVFGFRSGIKRRSTPNSSPQRRRSASTGRSSIMMMSGAVLLLEPKDSSTRDALLLSPSRSSDEADSPSQHYHYGRRRRRSHSRDRGRYPSIPQPYGDDENDNNNDDNNDNDSTLEKMVIQMIATAPTMASTPPRSAANLEFSYDSTVASSNQINHSTSQNRSNPNNHSNNNNSMSQNSQNNNNKSFASSSQVSQNDPAAASGGAWRRRRRLLGKSPAPKRSSRSKSGSVQLLLEIDDDCNQPQSGRASGGAVFKTAPASQPPPPNTVPASRPPTPPHKQPVAIDEPTYRGEEVDEEWDDDRNPMILSLQQQEQQHRRRRRTQLSMSSSDDEDRRSSVSSQVASRGAAGRRRSRSTPNSSTSSHQHQPQPGLSFARRPQPPPKQRRDRSAASSNNTSHTSSISMISNTSIALGGRRQPLSDDEDLRSSSLKNRLLLRREEAPKPERSRSTPRSTMSIAPAPAPKSSPSPIPLLRPPSDQSQPTSAARRSHLFRRRSRSRSNDDHKDSIIISNNSSNDSHNRGKGPEHLNHQEEAPPPPGVPEELLQSLSFQSSSEEGPGPANDQFIEILTHETKQRQNENWDTLQTRPDQQEPQQNTSLSEQIFPANVQAPSPIAPHASSKGGKQQRRIEQQPESQPPPPEKPAQELPEQAPPSPQLPEPDPEQPQQQQQQQHSHAEHRRNIRAVLSPLDQIMNGEDEDDDEIPPPASGPTPRRTTSIGSHNNTPTPPRKSIRSSSPLVLHLQDKGEGDDDDNEEEDTETEDEEEEETKPESAQDEAPPSLGSEDDAEFFPVQQQPRTTQPAEQSEFDENDNDLRYDDEADDVQIKLLKNHQLAAPPQLPSRSSGRRQAEQQQQEQRPRSPYKVETVISDTSNTTTKMTRASTSGTSSTATKMTRASTTDESRSTLLAGQANNYTPSPQQQPQRRPSPSKSRTPPALRGGSNGNNRHVSSSTSSQRRQPHHQRHQSHQSSSSDTNNNPPPRSRSRSRSRRQQQQQSQHRSRSADYQEDDWDSKDGGGTFDSRQSHTTEGTSLRHEFRQALDETVQKVIETFRCNPNLSSKQILASPTNVMSLFYDTLMCVPQEPGDQVTTDPKARGLSASPVRRRRPYYNEEFTQQWLRHMTTTGMSLLYLQAPRSPGNEASDEWKGRSVQLMIACGGACGSFPDSFSSATGDPFHNSNFGNLSNHWMDTIQPKLEWSTMAGGRSELIFTTSIPLLKIHSILTTNTSTAAGSFGGIAWDGDEFHEHRDDENLNHSGVTNNNCFLTITSERGDVHMFEAGSVHDRDTVLNGLRNVITRLSFHLITGDPRASVELYNEDDEDDHRHSASSPEPGDLPRLPNPRLNMNRIAHALLD